MSLNRMERLKIVFSDHKLEAGSEKKLDDLVLVIKDEESDIFSMKMLKKIIFTIENLGIGTELLVDNKKIFSNKYLEKMQKEGKWSGKIQVDDFLLRFGKVASMAQYFLIIEQQTQDTSITWEDWVTPFVSEERFVHAWVSNIEFDFWQNATDVLEYELAGKSYDGLPLKSNGLPFPLNEMEIDISKNPGRWLFKSGFIEAVGSKMWFGRLFWKCVGDRRERLRRLKWLEVIDLCHGVTAIKVPKVSFCDLSTSHIQDELREALYS